MIRILIVDDHEIIRKAVRSLIEAHPGWEVCGEAATGEAALDIALQEKPDIAILDVSLPVFNGVVLTRRLKIDCPNTRVLLFTMHDEDETILGGLAAGARGYVLKADSPLSLEAAISALAMNRPYFSSTISELLLDASMNGRKCSRLESFTARELQVAQLIAGGAANKAIAHNLDISIKTVECHRLAVMRKSGARNTGDFVRFAIKHNLILA